MKNTIFLLLSGLLSASVSPAKAQTADPKENAITSVLQVPQEKLYLHLDRPYYNAGDTLWFQGYLVNSITHEPIDNSRFIYVELIDETGTVVHRSKIRKGPQGFDGQIILPGEVQPGAYTLCAYTEWMRNAGNPFFYYRNLRIGNTLSTRINGSIVFSTDEKNHTTATLRFVNERGEPYTDTELECAYYNHGKKGVSKQRKTDKTGEAEFRFQAEPYERTAFPFVQVKLDSAVYNHTQRFGLPGPETAFAVRFCPEGGDLLAGTFQRIAFKAEQEDGSEAEVEGTVYTESGDSIVSFRSEYGGMNHFLLNAQPGIRYRAKVCNKAGQSLETELPPVQERGIALQLSRQGGFLRYAILKANRQPELDGLVLLAHTRGRVLFAESIADWDRIGKIDLTGIPTGITQFLLLDRNGNPLSERLFFQAPDSTVRGGFVCTTPGYDRRDSVHLQLQLQNEDNPKIPVSGLFSVSITDDESVSYPEDDDNIVSNLLLTSDLQGVVERPAHYLQTDRQTQFHADLLMMTHGWRRFNTANLLQKGEPTPIHCFEQGQTLSGTVTNLSKKPVEKAQITLLSDRLFPVTGDETDASGRFLIQRISFPEETLLLISASTAKNRQNTLMLQVDPDSFPVPDPLRIRTRLPELPLFDRYAKRSLEHYLHNEGTPMFELKEVVIEGEKRQRSRYLIPPGINSRIVDEKELALMGRQTALNIILSQPGIEGGENGPDGIHISISRSLNPPTLLIDGIEMRTLDELRYLMSDEIAQLRIEKGGTAAMYTHGMNGDGGVIMIDTRREVRSTKSDPLNSCRITPLGYAERIEFFQPPYHLPEKRRTSPLDLRNTLYWNPQLELHKGKADFNFYANDGAGRYTYRIEGITGSGTPFCLTGKIESR